MPISEQTWITSQRVLFKLQCVTVLICYQKDVSLLPNVSWTEKGNRTEIGNRQYCVPGSRQLPSNEVLLIILKRRSARSTGRVNFRFLAAQNETRTLWDGFIFCFTKKNTGWCQIGCFKNKDLSSRKLPIIGCMVRLLTVAYRPRWLGL